MKFTYFKTPINSYTFKSRRIRDWVEQHCQGKVLNLFAGEVKLSIPEIRNDIRKEMPADYHLDALKFCETWQDENFDTIILDPPYSYRKSMKDAICRIINKNAIVICFGYTSVCMGLNRSFVLEGILLIHHGGAIHDTIVSLERKQLVIR